MRPSTRLHQRSCVISSSLWSERVGREVLFKMDAWQPVGSFKIRGIGELCRRAVAEGARGLVSSSGGNAGLAAAHAGRRLGARVRVVVPETTGVFMRERLVREGAELSVHGAVWDEAHAEAIRLATESGDALVHPFEGEAIWSGHATLVEELADEGIEPAGLVVSVGGGGLLAGVLEGVERVGWHGLPVFAVETEGAASLRAALEHGAPQEIAGITSVAKSLGARRVGDGVFRRVLRYGGVRSLLVSDRQAVEACALLLDEHRVLVEPACGAALAAVLGHDLKLEAKGPLVVVVCGGAAVTRAELEHWLAVL